MTVGIVETNDGGSVLNWYLTRSYRRRSGFSTDTPDAEARSPWTRRADRPVVLSRHTRSGLLAFWVLLRFGVFA